MKKSMCLLLLAAAVFSISGCGNSSAAPVSSSSEEISEAAEYIYFNSDFQTLSGLDADELLSYLERMGDGHYQDIYITSEGEVCLALENDQHTFWLDAVDEKLSEEESELQELSSSYYCDLSDDHTVMNLYYDMCVSDQEAFAYIGDACIYCAMYQVIEGSDEWPLFLNVYNKDTGKLVAGGNLNNEV